MLRSVSVSVSVQRQFRFSFSLSSIALLLSTGSVFADHELIVTPKDSRGSAAIAQLMRQPGVVSSYATFGRVEKEFLKKSKLGRLASSRILVVKDENAEKALRSWVEKKKLPLFIEKNEIQLKLVGMDPLEKRQWGIHNTGKPEPLVYTDYTSIDIPGLTGEDTGIYRAPLEQITPEKQVIVAILDTGIDYDHPDLAAHLFRKEGECKAFAEYKSCVKEAEKQKKTEERIKKKKECTDKWTNVDTDGNQYPLDCSGWNLVTRDNLSKGLRGNPDASDKDQGHGTHVAGIIGAVGENGIGIRGMAQNVKLLPIKVMDESPNSPIRPQALNQENKPLPPPRWVEDKKGGAWKSSRIDIIARGFLYALNSGARVINLSVAWTPTADSQVVREMVQAAIDRGVVVVASAGNDSTFADVLPCQYPGVVCVGAHGPDGAMAYFSNYGSTVDISAPGFRILSTWPTNMAPEFFYQDKGYDYMDGTSMAAPFVTGAFARMLGAGFDARESYARLMLGARPTAPAPAVLRGSLYPEKYTLSGNLDLARSFEVKPMPLILPSERKMIRAEWDRVSSRIPFAFALRNLWFPAGATEVRLDLVPGKAPLHGHLARQSWNFSSWNSDEVKSIQAELVVEDARISQEFAVDVTVAGVSSDGASFTRTFRTELEVIVPVKKNSADPEMRTLAIHVPKLSEDAYLRSVVSWQGDENPDYLIVDPSLQDFKLHMLREENGAYQTAATATIKPILKEVAIGDKKIKLPWIVRTVFQVDRNLDGKLDYAVIFQDPGMDSVAIAPFKFYYFDQNLNPILVESSKGTSEFQDYANDPTQIPDRFQWFKIRENGKDLFVPAWIALGPESELDKGPFDPWEEVNKPFEVRLYYLSSEGLRSRLAPKGYFFLQALSPTDDQKNQGAIPVLMAEGDSCFGSDFKLNYVTGVVRGDETTDQKEFKLGRFRNFCGINNLPSMVSLTPGQSFPGTAFVGPSLAGSLRSTAMIPDGEGFKVLDAIQKPAALSDSVIWVNGIVSGKERTGVFAETHYEVQFHDLNTGQIALTSLHRYTFVSEILTYNAGRFAIAVKNSTNPESDFLPGILIAANIGSSGSMEVLVPAYDDQGKLLGLTKPARMHLDANGCKNLARIDAVGSKPAQAVFYCGDRFLRFPISY